MGQVLLQSGKSLQHTKVTIREEFLEYGKIQVRTKNKRNLLKKCFSLEIKDFKF
jgi:hypothetical protein